MEVTPKELRRYVTDDGWVPFGEWLDGLRDMKARAVIAKRLTRVALGNFGDHKGVGDGVQELRIDFGPGYSVYFAEHDATIIVLPLRRRQGDSFFRHCECESVLGTLEGKER
jgi:putative addiction module killer protein